MVKRTQTIRRLLPTNCLSVFDHFVGLVLKGLSKENSGGNIQTGLSWVASGDFEQLITQSWEFNS